MSSIMHKVVGLIVFIICNFLEQVSEEVERALTKLGHGKLAGRYVPIVTFQIFEA